MPQTQALTQYKKLMEEYTDFLEKMVSDESEKLAALSSRELPRIEHSISMAQANAKQLENYEAKRISLQREAGFSGLTFREVVAGVEEDEYQEWSRLYERFERSIGEIRFRNDKSMTVARDNMMMLDPEAVLPGAKNANPYGKMKQEQNEQTTILETKI